MITAKFEQKRNPRRRSKMRPICDRAPNVILERLWARFFSRSHTDFVTLSNMAILMRFNPVLQVGLC